MSRATGIPHEAETPAPMTKTRFLRRDRFLSATASSERKRVILHPPCKSGASVSICVPDSEQRKAKPDFPQWRAPLLGRCAIVSCPPLHPPSQPVNIYHVTNNRIKTDRSAPG